MKHSNIWLPTVTATIAMLSPLHAAAILFEITDLPNIVVTEDLWQYKFYLSDISLLQGEGFSIYFDFNLYKQLENPPPAVNGGWDVLTVDPDINLSSDGFYDGLALIASPSLNNAFTTTFVWTGAGTPGSQPFVIYDSAFSTTFSGQTVPVPELHATSLALVSATLLLGLRRRAS